MKKLEFEAKNDNRLFGNGEEPEFAVEKMLELLRSGSFDARGFDDDPLEAKLETDNYALTLKPKVTNEFTRRGNMHGQNDICEIEVGNADKIIIEKILDIDFITRRGGKFRIFYRRDDDKLHIVDYGKIDMNYAEKEGSDEKIA